MSGSIRFNPDKRIAYFTVRGPANGRWELKTGQGTLNQRGMGPETDKKLDAPWIRKGLTLVLYSQHPSKELARARNLPNAKGTIAFPNKGKKITWEVTPRHMIQTKLYVLDDFGKEKLVASGWSDKRTESPGWLKPGKTYALYDEGDYGMPAIPRKLLAKETAPTITRQTNSPPPKMVAAPQPTTTPPPKVTPPPTPTVQPPNVEGPAPAADSPRDWYFPYSLNEDPADDDVPSPTPISAPKMVSTVLPPAPSGNGQKAFLSRRTIVIGAIIAAVILTLFVILLIATRKSE